MAHSNSADDQWASTADLYSNQAARLTELHGADLVAILKDDIAQAKTILDVGCGTGAFAKAYIQQFPKGVPGQTLVLSDLSAGMLEKAEGALRLPADFHTKVVFQIEDGTKLEGIQDSSVDIVVSLFGVFLIPDQEATLKAIKRVLRKPRGIFANVSWIFNTSEQLVRQGFGVSLQDAFQVPLVTIDQTKKDQDFVTLWSDRVAIREMLCGKYKFESADVFQATHTSVWEFKFLWEMMVKNPMSNIQGAAETDVQRAKEALEKFVTNDGSVALEKPLMLSTASNICVARGLSTEN